VLRDALKDLVPIEIFYSKDEILTDEKQGYYEASFELGLTCLRQHKFLSTAFLEAILKLKESEEAQQRI
jgi:hypothetical protein